MSKPSIMSFFKKKVDAPEPTVEKANLEKD
jgi:hypothetical protein